MIAAETEADFEDAMNEIASESGITREELDAHYDKRQTPRGTYGQVKETLESFASSDIERFYLQGPFTPADTDRLLDGLGIGSPPRDG